jgi:hypothetical protein
MRRLCRKTATPGYICSAFGIIYKAIIIHAPAITLPKTNKNERKSMTRASTEPIHPSR